KKIVLIDPSRDPQPFYDYADQNSATIIAVIETHPHADFVSSHAEIYRKLKARIYASEKLHAKYPHHPVKDGDVIALNNHLLLKILDTPGHSPDSISIVLREDNIDKAVFTGDALLFGDVGRPDLREYGKNENEQRASLAKAMYNTVQKKYSLLDDQVIVYPAHGAGSLCGNAIRNVKSSTIGEEKRNNHAFHHVNESDFVASILKDLPFIPKYFPYDVELNRSGAGDVQPAISKVQLREANFKPAENALVVDIRPGSDLKDGYYPGAIHVPEGAKFETWFGTVVAPDEKFYLAVQNSDAFHTAVKKLSKIGYESNIAGGFVYTVKKPYPVFLNGKPFSLSDKDDYTIIDVRNKKEYDHDPIISSSVNIPLPELDKRLKEIPKDKPIVVHCASGYRSSIATSIIRKEYPQLSILDLGEEVIRIKKQKTY
ncbi:MAG TPA: rhodanese-like domain-containing protein, partial [Niabella sp.]|nr:rhodanese-like domain-containing protein [Niabella sp.]